MREVIGNLWTANASVRIIPTNGSVTTVGNAVMGKGVAFQAAQRFPMLPRELGKKLRLYGNQVFYFESYKLITFPTKEDWREPSTVALLEKSIQELRAYLNPTMHYAMPRIGAGFGGLDWHKQVRPLLKDLPDNVIVVHMQ